MIRKIICWLFSLCPHDWGKWEELGKYGYGGIKLKRTCSKCGFIKTKVR